MKYRIKEIYFTQQGEGKNTGKDFVFVRFSGCNLWNGKENIGLQLYVIFVTQIFMVLMA